jgi:hypothetical protein
MQVTEIQEDGELPIPQTLCVPGANSWAAQIKHTLEPKSKCSNNLNTCGRLFHTEDMHSIVREVLWDEGLESEAREWQ